MSQIKPISKDAMSAWMKAKYSAYVPRQREQNEALPTGINTLDLPVYVPQPMAIARHGADDHKRYRSLMS